MNSDSYFSQLSMRKKIMIEIVIFFFSEFNYCEEFFVKILSLFVLNNFNANF